MVCYERMTVLVRHVREVAGDRKRVRLNVIDGAAAAGDDAAVADVGVRDAVGCWSADANTVLRSAALACRHYCRRVYRDVVVIENDDGAAAVADHDIVKEDQELGHLKMNSHLCHVTEKTSNDLAGREVDEWHERIDDVADADVERKVAHGFDDSDDEKVVAQTMTNDETVVAWTTMNDDFDDDDDVERMARVRDAKVRANGSCPRQDPKGRYWSSASGHP